jgi:dienelactone hydrolase
MIEVVLFHHAQGLTPGVVAFADELRRAGHTVHTPDLFEGRTFGSIEAGMGFVEEAKDAELFLYPGDQHYFADSSLPSYDHDAATLLTERVLGFLADR